MRRIPLLLSSNAMATWRMEYCLLTSKCHRKGLASVFFTRFSIASVAVILEIHKYVLSNSREEITTDKGQLFVDNGTLRCSRYEGNDGDGDNEEEGDNEEDDDNDGEDDNDGDGHEYDDYEDGDPFDCLERDLGDQGVVDEMMYRQYENDILESIVNSDNGVDTDEEMFNGVDLENDKEGINDAGPSRRRLEKPLPFYLDSADTGKLIVEEDDDVTITDDAESVVEFRKGMRFKNKKELIKTVNTFCIKNHYNYDIIETDKIKWAVICSENGGGCKWRLRGRQRSCDHEFEITIVGEPHTCLNAVLTQDHPRIDCNFMAPYFRIFVKESPEVKLNKILGK
ncbi:hypothetical protein MLD38_013144 [Melastoma candidum]|uniref:Uncharacterized protein n=1 Tax=Melastoma candidum TaxID=119954 RepID=A0ACB9R891_9MYRT|nr:hypothetical protein MLD38_013144 [Melastoma candidum]